MMVQSNGQTATSYNIYTAGKSRKVYGVRMLDRCKQDYSKLIKKNTKLHGVTQNILEELKIRPYLGEKLFANFPGCRSIHFIGNSYRIVYRILDTPEDEILILDIGHRSSSYANLAKVLGQGK